MSVFSLTISSAAETLCQYLSYDMRVDMGLFSMLFLLTYCWYWHLMIFTLRGIPFRHALTRGTCLGIYTLINDGKGATVANASTMNKRISKRAAVEREGRISDNLEKVKLNPFNRHVQPKHKIKILADLKKYISLLLLWIPCVCTLYCLSFFSFLLSSFLFFLLGEILDLGSVKSTLDRANCPHFQARSFHFQIPVDSGSTNNITRDCRFEANILVYWWGTNTRGKRSCEWIIIRDAVVMKTCSTFHCYILAWWLSLKSDAGNTYNIYLHFQKRNIW